MRLARDSGYVPAWAALASMIIPGGAALGQQDRYPDEIERRIARVETGLLLPTQVRGRPPDRHALETRMRYHGVPAVSVAVIHRGEIEWARAWGLADPDTGAPATTETLFQAASMSKPVAALAALRLVERGALDLDEDIGPYLAGWRIPRGPAAGAAPITLRRLLTHTAGLTVHGFLGYAAGAEVPATFEVLEGTAPANSPPVVAEVPPGSEWRYSGGGYTIVQLLVEQHEGQPLQAVMRSILDDLGMKGSTYDQPLPDSLAARAAAGYRASDRPVPGRWHTYPEMAAAGLWTTPSDVARYMLAVGRWLGGAERGVLSREMTARMLTPGLGSWGLGPSIEGEGIDLQFSHGGSNEGFRAQFIMYPRRGLGAVVMTNSDTGLALAEEILFGISDVYEWPGVTPRQIQALPLSRRAALEYAGRFVIEDAPDIPVTIAWRRGGLELRVAGRPPSEIVRTGADRFTILADGESIRFERDASGRVEAVVAYGTRARREPSF